MKILKRIKYNSLIFKTILISSSITIIALLIVLTISVSSSMKSLNNTIAEQLREKSSMTGNQIDDFFEQRIKDVKKLSQADVLESSNKEAIVQYFDELIQIDPATSNIWVLEIDKQSVFGTDSDYSSLSKFPNDVKEQVELVFQSNQGDVYLTDAIEFNKGLSVFLLTPITDDANINVVSVLIIEVSLKPVQKIVSIFNDNVIGDKYVYLLNDDSEVIATDDTLQGILELFYDINVWKDLLKSTEVDGATGYEIYTDYYGIDVMAGMADMEAHGMNEALDWGIVAVAEMSVIADPAIKLRNYLIIFTLLVSVIIIGVMAFFMKYSLSGILKMNKVMTTISKGYLARNVDEDLLSKKDEIGLLANSFNSMVLRLREIIVSIKSNIENVNEGSQQISMSAQSIAQGANEQSASSEQISASIEEMVASINQNTENAQQTEKIALKAEKGIVEGHQASINTLKTMQNIAVKIVVITEIAEKIDLLAINAAVEAARAGEYGKGFAVVSGEIRKLAENTQNSANEIVKLVNLSLEIAEKSGDVLTEIVPDVKKTARLVQEITATSTEQNYNASQINGAVQQLSLVIQQNSAATEELSTSAEELVNQNASLHKGISFFNFSEIKNDTEQMQEMVMEYVAEAFKKMKIKEVDNYEILFKSHSETANNEEDQKTNNKTQEETLDKNKGINLKIDEEKEVTDEEFEKYKE